jgi:hypothetical protein
MSLTAGSGGVVGSTPTSQVIRQVASAAPEALPIKGPFQDTP